MQENWLIAVDLDGTLFHTDHHVSKRTLKAVHEVVKLGHSFVVVTGRSAHSALPKLSGMPADTAIICSNGAYEYDRANEEVVWANTLSSANALELRRRIVEQLPTASFGWEATSGIEFEQEFAKEAGGAHTLEQGGVQAPLGSADIYKLFVRTPERNGSALAGKLRNILAGGIEVSSSGAPFAEITAVGVNKGAALSEIASRLGFESSRTIAFGDNQNDVSMLEWAGESVAMGNAVPELTSIADAQTLSNAEDGVAHYLEHKFLT